MKEYIIRIGKITNMKIIRMVKKHINMRKIEYRDTRNEYNINKLPYEDYILRSQISVFRYRRDL